MKPSIIAQPASQTAFQGGSVNLSVTAVGGGPYSYQWKKDGLDIFEATQATLTLNNVQYADAGSYSVVVTNTSGTATSDGANLTVVSAVWGLFSSAESALVEADTGLVNLSPIDKMSVVTGAASRSGVDALKLQTVDGGSTYAERTIVGPAVVSFSWRVSSEQDFDLFQYSVDGSVRETISGDGAWLNRSLTLGAGTHTIRWTYSKDEADANFDDAGYLDDLVIVESYTNLEVSSAGNVITGSSTLDFGTVPQNAPEITQSLTLKNTGTISQSVTASLPTDDGFVFGSGLRTASLTLSAGQQSTLVLKMPTMVEGHKSVLLGITAMGSRTAAPAITLTGFVEAPSPKISCNWGGGAIASGQDTAIDFGATPNDITFTVNNSGFSALTIASVSISPSGDFQLISPPASMVEVNGSTTFTLRALDANRGNHLATATIVSNDPNTPNFSIPLASESTPNIVCSWSGGEITSDQGTAIDFGATPNDITFTVGNTGTGIMTISSVNIAPAENFQVISQPSSTVAIGGTTKFTLRALDVNRGNHQATVIIASDAPNAPSFNIPVVSESTPNIVCSWSGGSINSDLDTAIDFGATPNDITFTVGNTGTAKMTIASVIIAPIGNFQVISPPAPTVEVNGSTTFTLRALDANRGNHQATVTIVSDAANVPSFNIPVKSESNPKIECSWDGGAITAGQGTAVDFGATPSEVVITIASTGTAALNLASVSVSPAGDFQVTSQPTSTVAVGSTTTLTLRALDANRGIHQATVTIANNDADTPYFRFPLVSKSYLAVAGTGFNHGSFTNSGTTIGWDLATTTLANGSSGQAIKTGATPNSGDSTIGATFEGPGLLSWNWKVSAQQGYDWLVCVVNGVEVAGISTKTAAWQSQVVQIPAGSQVRWIYRKDATNSAGTDSGYLSDIRFSKFTAAQSSFQDWSAAHGNLAPTQLIPAGGMQAMFAWLGGVDPATGPSAGQYQPSVSGGFYKYRYTVAKAAAGIVQPQISTDLVTWNSRKMKQTLISEDDASAVVELSVPATGKVFSRFATEMPAYSVPAPTGFVLVAAGSLPSSSGMGTQNVAAFYMAQTETTWGQWQTVRAWAVGHGYDLANVGAGNGDNFPVMSVNWYHVVKWCNARSEMEGLTPVYTVNGSIYRSGNSAPVLNASANGYRLPGEAEWEFAARGGVNTQGYTYSGSNDLNAVAWYLDNSGYASHSVATKQVNELGLSDMSGNVWEWCYDWYPGYEGSYRVGRGGGWYNDAYYCRVAYRSSVDPSYADSVMGFRVARSSVPQ